MLHGKIAQFRVVPYLARKKIDLSDRILELIDLSQETLEDLAAAEDEKDEYLGKDMQFHRVKLRPDWIDVDPDELSDEYIEDDEDIQEIELEDEVYDEENPRRSKRVARTMPARPGPNLGT